jgi:hypothetical protein
VTAKVAMLRPKRKAPPSPARKRYVLNEQVGFLLRVGSATRRFSPRA